MKNYLYNPQTVADKLELPVDIVEDYVDEYITQAIEFKEKIYDSMVAKDDFVDVKSLIDQLLSVAENLRIEDSIASLNTIYNSDNNITINEHLIMFYKSIEKLKERDSYKDKFFEFTKELSEEDMKSLKDEYYSSILETISINAQCVQNLEMMVFFGEEKELVLKKAYMHNPTSFRYKYVEHILYLASLYERNTQIKRAIDLYNIAFTITLELSLKGDANFVKLYIKTSSYLISIYKKRRQKDKAREIELDNLKTFRELYKSQNVEYLLLYLNVLNKVVSSYEKREEYEEAIALYVEGVEITKELPESKDPIEWKKLFVSRVTYLGFLYEKNSQIDKAIESHTLAMEIAEDFYSKYPSVWEKEYTDALNNLAYMYMINDQLVETIYLLEKLLKIVKELYSIDKDKWALTYKRALAHLSSVYKDYDQDEESVELAQEAIKIELPLKL